MFVDGSEVWASAHPPDDFEQQIVVFTASGATATIRFNNNSPVRRRCLFNLCLASAHIGRMDVVAQGGDNSVFIDFIRINAVVVQGQISIPNPSFEENTEVAGFNYQLPNGWQGSGGGTVVVNSPPSAPNGPWGAGSAVAQGAPDGNYFMSIQGVGNYLEQTLTGLTPGSNYEVAFWATHRRDAAGLDWGGALEELMVVVDGTIIWDSTHPPDDFQAFAAAFTAQSDTAVLQFKNNSPGECTAAPAPFASCAFFRRSLRDAAAQAATTRCSWTW